MALKDDDQPATSYKLPIGDVSADILADIDNGLVYIVRDALPEGIPAATVSGCLQLQALSL